MPAGPVVRPARSGCGATSGAALLHPRDVDLVEVVAPLVDDAAAAGPLPHQRVLARAGLPAEELRAGLRGVQAPAGGLGLEVHRRGLRQVGPLVGVRDAPRAAGAEDAVPD